MPAPATVLLLEGLVTTPSEETYEQVTPTGAAILAALIELVLPRIVRQLANTNPDNAAK